MEQVRKTVPEQISEKMGEYYVNGIQSIFENGAELQRQVLEDMIALCKDTTYAKDHGFGGIQTKEEFKAKVPVSEYSDYVSYIEENMHNDAGQLTALPTEYYLLSTGKDNKGKYFVENKLGALSRELSIGVWNLHLTKIAPIMTDPNVRMLAVTNCSPIDKAPNGKAVRRTSSQAAKGLWERNPDLYVFPYEFLEAEMSNDDRDYLTALYTLKQKGFNMLFCNNLSYFGVLLDWIDKAAPKMIEDIRLGKMSVTLSAKDREILECGFSADEARADELQQLLDSKGKLLAEDIWPDFTVAGVWLTGSVGWVSRDVMRRLPEKVQYIAESYGASEGMFTIPMEYGCAYGPLAPYSCYFEFLPLDGGQPLDMTEVVDGEYYELLVTTYSGLYRYNLHDVVQIKGYTGTTANVDFCCRTTDNWLVGDKKLYGYELELMMEEFESKTGKTITYYQAKTNEQKLDVIVEVLEEVTDKVEFYQQMAEVMKEHEVALGKVYFMKRGYHLAQYELMMTNGRTIQAMKLPIPINHEPLENYVAEVVEG